MKSTDLITEHFRLNDFQRKALGKLRIHTVIDLLYHFPVRYGDTSETQSISGLIAGQNAVVFGKISGLKAGKSFKSKMTMATAMIEDSSGKIPCTWFNQPYLAKMTPEGAFVRIEGKVNQRRKKTPDATLYFSNPKVEVVNKLPTGVGNSLFGKDGEVHTLYPVYPESQGITSNWLYYAVQKIFKSELFEKKSAQSDEASVENHDLILKPLLDPLPDPIPEYILKKYNLPSLKTALIWIHAPIKKEDADVARKRFAFEEIFFIQIEKRLARREYEAHPAWKIERDEKSISQFVKRFPFDATDAQKQAIDTVLTDFSRSHAMARLLEGDVGSGKTAVAATATYAIVANKIKGLQVAYMCPTEILATQHFESFIQYFSYLGIQIGLITGSGCRKFPSKLNPKGWTDISRTQLLTWVAGGEISVLIGTHALIQKAVAFKNLALVIIDEQHRFGTNQRSLLIRKEAAPKKGKVLGNRNTATSPTVGSVNGVTTETKTPLPHLLSMTATPIPRTLALTIYGDLDLTLLDQMPHGRKPIITTIVLPTDRETTYEKIRNELKLGRQVYVICPRIDEQDQEKKETLYLKSVKEEAKRLKEKVFPEYTIGVLHGKMKPDEKDRVMLDFKAGKINILCATSVIEVGVNVPNATVIIIEGGERFGLAQLHQLRGRVIRSNDQAYCYIFTESNSEKTAARLKALSSAKNGFELAEHDLQQRGAGSLAAGKQWGVSDIAMEALKNMKMVEAARHEARAIVDTDPALEQFPIIATELKLRQKNALHFE